MNSLSCIDFKFLAFRLEVQDMCFVFSALIWFKTKDASKIFKVEIVRQEQNQLIERVQVISRFSLSLRHKKH